MCTVRGAWREVIHVSAVDYLSGETLLDMHVKPEEEVVDWASEITGITSQAIEVAVASNNALLNWSDARQKLWTHIDASTILIGQSLHFDLEVLGMLHARVVDSEMLSTQAISFVGARRRSLQVLCKIHLGVKIQGREHDCLEDTLAARELVIWWGLNPAKVKKWAAKMRRGEERQAREKEERKRRKLEREVAEERERERRGMDEEEEELSDDEVLRWEDVAVDLGWPHPDTGYDPWSD